MRWARDSNKSVQRILKKFLQIYSRKKMSTYSSEELSSGSTEEMLQKSFLVCDERLMLQGESRSALNRLFFLKKKKGGGK